MGTDCKKENQSAQRNTDKNTRQQNEHNLSEGELEKVSGGALKVLNYTESDNNKLEGNNTKKKKKNNHSEIEQEKDVGVKVKGTLSLKAKVRKDNRQFENPANVSKGVNNEVSLQRTADDEDPVKVSIALNTEDSVDEIEENIDNVDVPGENETGHINNSTISLSERFENRKVKCTVEEIHVDNDVNSIAGKLEQALKVSNKQESKSGEVHKLVGQSENNMSADTEGTEMSGLPCDENVGEEENSYKTELNEGSNETDDGAFDVDDKGYGKAYRSSPVSFLDCGDDDSDEDLPAFMHTGDDINGWSSATKIDTGLNKASSPSSSDLSVERWSPEKSLAYKPGSKNKFTLDGLVADHKENADLVREMDDINRELQDELKQGGFVNILNKHDSSYTESEINDEQRNILRHFEIQETQLRGDRPGVQVFKPQNYCQVFNSALHPTHCGFAAGTNGLSLEKHIQSVVPAQYKLLITSGMITQCFTKITCQSQLLRWIFFIMSVHSDYQVQEGCKKVLLEILHYQTKYSAQKWTPRLSDLLSVFVNYGASLESLVNCSSNTIEIIRSKLLYLQGYNPPVDLQGAGYKIENLILVLQILSRALHGQSGRYSPTDLNLLCAVLCKASLDTNLKHGYAADHFQNCVAMAIKHYTESDWSKERLKLARMLVNIATHHHDRAHIAQLLPPGVRGSYVQRRYSYLVLNDILLKDTEITDNELEALEIQDMEPFVCHIKDLLENDSYKLSSVITLMDLCVGVNLTLKSAQREQLKALFEKVKGVRLQDNVSFLDRTRVKDSIVRMTSKWLLDIQTLKGKQTKIFEYASPVKMRIEMIRTVQTEEDDESDHELPSKMVKVTPPEQN